MGEGLSGRKTGRALLLFFNPLGGYVQSSVAAGFQDNKASGFRIRQRVVMPEFIAQEIAEIF